MRANILDKKVKYDKVAITKNYVIKISTAEQFGYFKNRSLDKSKVRLLFMGNKLLDIINYHSYILPDEVKNIIVNFGFDIHNLKIREYIHSNQFYNSQSYECNNAFMRQDLSCDALQLKKAINI